MTLEPLDSRLLDHLDVEFGSHGRRAVEFLLTARTLLDRESGSGPRLPEAVAYCLREAMKAIPSSTDAGDGGRWRSASRLVADRRRRFELVRGIPGEDEVGALDELLESIDDLERVHSQESIHERRLIAIMVSRTGALPLVAGTAPIRAYQDLVSELDTALHADSDLDHVKRLWNRCAVTLRQLFLPPELRHAELESLAAKAPDSAEDVERLLSLIAGPNHLRHFLRQIRSPDWLNALTDTGILDPPPDYGSWAAFTAVDRLAPDYGQALADWLESLYSRHAADSTRAGFVARAASDIGVEGAPTVLRILRDHAGDSLVAAAGVRAVENLDPHMELVESFADVLLNEAASRSSSYVDPVIERVVEGLDETNAARRLQLLCWKLGAIRPDQRKRRWLLYERAGSIADWDDDDGHGDRFAILLHALVETVRRSRGWIRAVDALPVVNALPDDIRGRVSALVLAGDPDVELSVVIDEVTRAISERDPTGDDLPLIDRVIAEGAPEHYSPAWSQALGPAPSVVEVSQQLSAHDLPPRSLRAFHWSGVLPEGVSGPWAQPASVIAGAYGKPSRESLEMRHQMEFANGRSPFPSDELASMSVTDAAMKVSSWRPDPEKWLVSARELARALEAVVKSHTAEWLASPLRVATDLRHPTYIHHYLRAVAEAIKSGSYPPVNETLDVIGLVKAHPWAADPLGKDDFDYDHDWSGAERAAVDVLKALADQDVGLQGRDDEVWDMLDAEVRDRSEPSGITSGARDPLDSAINRRCTRALEAVLSFMAYEFRTTASVRSPALCLLEDALRLPGSDGAEHRAIIGTRLGFLRHIAADWVDGVTPLIFGADAPDGLAHVTADLAIKWSRPNRWFLERFPDLVRDAVTRDVDHALEQLLIAMLWEVPSYTVEDNISFLRKSSGQVSKAGETLGRLLRHDDAEESHISHGVRFWDAALLLREPESLPGFGWFADVERMPGETWATRTMATLSLTGGRIDWAHAVAKRAAALPPSTTTLAIMNSLVRGTADEWDRRGNIERAASLLRASEQLNATPEYERLRTTLLERGAL